MRKGIAVERVVLHQKSGLGRYLVVALILKAVVLTLLWHVFIKPNRVTVNEAAMGSHLAATHLQTQLEKSHDRLNGR